MLLGYGKFNHLTTYLITYFYQDGWKKPKLEMPFVFVTYKLPSMEYWFLGCMDTNMGMGTSTIRRHEQFLKN